MSTRRILIGAALAVTLALLACAPDESDQVGVDFRMTGITREQVSEVQISIVSDAPSIQGNAELAHSCIKDIVTDRSRFVAMEDGKKFFRFNATETKPQVINGITVGNNYFFVAEAVSKDTQKLIARGSFVVGELKAGGNAIVPITVSGNDAGTPIADCDPRF